MLQPHIASLACCVASISRSRATAFLLKKGDILITLRETSDMYKHDSQTCGWIAVTICYLAGIPKLRGVLRGSDMIQAVSELIMAHRINVDVTVWAWR